MIDKGVIKEGAFRGYHYISEQKVEEQPPVEVSAEQESKVTSVPFMIKRNKKKWTFTNKQTGKMYFVQINPRDEFASLYAFLAGISASFSDDVSVVASHPFDYKQMTQSLITNGMVDVWIPSNAVENVKAQWLLNGSLEDVLEAIEYYEFQNKVLQEMTDVG